MEIYSKAEVDKLLLELREEFKTLTFKPWLTIDELITEYSISKPTFYKWRDLGLKIHVIGKRVLIKRLDIDNFFEYQSKNKLIMRYERNSMCKRR